MPSTPDRPAGSARQLSAFTANTSARRANVATAPTLTKINRSSAT